MATQPPNVRTEYARAHMSKNEWRAMRRVEFEVWVRAEVRSHHRRLLVPRVVRRRAHRPRRDPA